MARWSCINLLQLLPSVQLDAEKLQVNSQLTRGNANGMRLKTVTIVWNAFLNAHLWSNFAANQKDSSENRKRLPRIRRVLREAAGFLQRMLGLYMYITFSGTSTLIPTISVSTGTSVSNPTTDSCATRDVWRYFSRKSSSAITVCSLCHKVLAYHGGHEYTSGTTSSPGYYLVQKLKFVCC